MQLKIRRYLILLCVLGGIVLPATGWCVMHPARGLPPIDGVESIQVDVTSSANNITLNYTVPRATLSLLEDQVPCGGQMCTPSL